MANVPGFTLNAPTNPLIDPGAGTGGNVLPSTPVGFGQSGYLRSMWNDLKQNPFKGGVGLNPMSDGMSMGRFGSDETPEAGTPRRSAAYRRAMEKMLTDEPDKPKEVLTGPIQSRG